MSTGPTVPPAGRHGGDGPAVARALGLDPGSLLDLSQNLNPFAPDVATLAALHLGELRRYPDPAAASRLLAGAMGVDPARLVLTNGAAEAIGLVAGEIGGRVQSEPEFGLHPRGDAGPVWRSDPHNVALRVLPPRVRRDAGPVWRSDPHNPSGCLAGSDDAADVWDEAFYALATGRWTAGRDGIVVGSLTKTFACPGLRLGYLIADDVARFAHRQPQWSVGSLALALLADLLERADPVGWATAVAGARRDLVELLETRGLTVQAADAPWVLVQAPGLREALAPHGVLVRDCAGFGLRGTARIAVGDAGDLARLAAALDRAGFTGEAADTGLGAAPGAAGNGAGTGRRPDIAATVSDAGDSAVDGGAADGGSRSRREPVGRFLG
ncbi:MAG: aminotransferase class I/II-fold pyridoxal phosphate-dependent enzyme [bacterium]|nr:aminotransferase class I/II-fold pyridoxal phosphate-dependent enzyme [bacterium]